VTGGTRGIGLAIAHRLLADGMAVVATYAHDEAAADEVRAAARAHRWPLAVVRCDAASPAAVAGLFASDEARSLDVLVHAAGFTRDRFLMLMPDRDLDDLLAVHATGAFLASRHALPAMQAAGWGRIVYLVSASALLGRAGQTNYSAAKGSLIGLCRALAREVGASGVTVNCVSAGLVETRLTADLPPEVRDELVAAIPLRRPGQPEEIAAVVGFLCSEGAAYITGQVIAADGGLT
jgi:3-oxoacyl-[acyl-carrier protein] reductase